MTQLDLTLAEIFGLLNEQITNMDVRLSRQFTEQTGGLLSFKEHFTGQLRRVADRLDGVQKRLDDIQRVLKEQFFMTTMIMLTEEEAEQVRGPSATDPSAALDPVPEPNGDHWMLPLAVLDDPAHAEHKDFLAGLPQEDVDTTPPEAEVTPAEKRRNDTWQR